ncbi:MAG: sirohydrochlorin chelatase [Nitrospiraceae bacterium]
MKSPGLQESARHGVVLVGHGGVPRDLPRDLLMKLKAMEGKRRATNSEPTREEIDLETRIRRWPRTPATDPYQAGLEALAAHLKPALHGAPLALAYNEFCAPSVEEAVEAMVSTGITRITLVPSMLTPGGSHSEIEIPESLERLRVKHPGIQLRYAWPFDLTEVASMLAAQIHRFQN